MSVLCPPFHAIVLSSSLEKAAEESYISWAVRALSYFESDFLLYAGDRHTP